jgi:hypothetical protein
LRADVLTRLRNEPWSADEPGDLVDRIATSMCPVVGLRFAPGAADEKAVPLGASKTGGLRHVPPGFDWPTEGTGEPLSLVCQINLAEVARAMPGPLPATGMRAVDRAIEMAGGVPVGVARMFGDAHLFREEMREEYDPVRQRLLLTVDGYALAKHAFGEGTFHVLVDRDALAAGDVSKSEVIFEPGT